MRKHMMMTHWEDGWHFEFPQSNKSSRVRDQIPSSSNPLPPPSSWLKCGWNASSFSSFWHFKFPQFNKSSCALTGNINSVPHISITDILHLKDDGIQLRALFSTICGFPHPCKSQYCGIPGSHLECVANIITIITIISSSIIIITHAWMEFFSSSSWMSSPTPSSLGNNWKQ